MGKLTISMAMFKFANCNKLPEGIYGYILRNPSDVNSHPFKMGRAPTDPYRWAPQRGSMLFPRLPLKLWDGIGNYR